MFKKIVGLGFSTKGKNAKKIESYIKSFVDGGADEFMSGYNPKYWYEKFGFEVSPNGRFSEHEQITDFETLKAIVAEVHKYNLEIFINLNSWYYTDETFPYIQKMYQEFLSIGVDGIICGNIGILEYLKEQKYTGKINISTILSAYNKEAIGFYLDNYNINKIILGREVTLKEIESITAAFPATKFEVFGEGDFCRYNNGLCFAEHKYGSRDICTVVVNDLVEKHKFKSDFKKTILNPNLSNLEKEKLLRSEHKHLFNQIENILEDLELGIGDKEEIESTLFRKIVQNKNRVDLFFDTLKSPTEKHNRNMIKFLKGIKYLLNHSDDLSETLEEELTIMKKELENGIKKGLKFFCEEVKRIGGRGKIKANEVGGFYNRSDNLNLYSYLFFDKIKNIDTVKFPTRGRNYNEKLNTIKDVLKLGKVHKSKYLNISSSIERTHYDLTYIFGDKLRFRKMLQKIK